MMCKKSERGQALVLIVFAIVALVGLTGLAIDGGNAYSDRRNAQNAADTAALAAALSKVRGADQTAWQAIGEQRASSNGYTDSSNGAVVRIYECDQSNGTDQPSCNLPATEDPTQYVSAAITSSVRTYFAQVVGIRQMTNTVQAVAHVVPSVNSPLFNGAGMSSLNLHDCSAINFQGGAGLTLNGSGIFDNSDCNSTTNGAFNTNTGSGTIDAPCLSVVGTITTGTNTNLNDDGCEPTTSQLTDPTSTYPQPNIPCDNLPTPTQYTDSSGNKHITQGYYSGAFPPAGVTVMDSGTYCIDAGNQGFKLSGGQVLNGDSVLIKMVSGAVSWSSGAVDLSGPPVGTYYGGLLLYVDPSTDCSKVTINGNGKSTFTGTILAPCSLISIEGSAGGTGYNDQFIGDTVSISGSSNITINYDAGQNWEPPKPPQLQLTK